MELMPLTEVYMKNIITIFVLSFITFICYGGRLDDFEHGATENSTSPKDHHFHNDGDDDDFAIEVEFAEAIFNIMVFGGRHSHLRMDSDYAAMTDDVESIWDFEVKPRELGEPITPLLKFETAYWYQDSDLYGTLSRFETGYGCVGFQLNNSYFRESDPTDDMNLMSWHILYRMSFSKHFEIGLGLGTAAVLGDNENSGSSFTMPIRMHTDKNWGIEYKPEWININGNRFADYDLGFYVDFKYGSAIVGYRWWDTKYTSLEGPYVGFAVRF
jgi:hypothetical protein